MSQKRIIIIGATSGIGRELALLYCTAKHKVGVTGRRQNLLNSLLETYPQQVVTAGFDVMDGANRVHMDYLINQLGGLDLLIYNSGYGEPSVELDYQTENRTTKTNVTGFLEIVNYGFNYFLKQGYGQIAVISSVAALRGNSWAPAYSASKAYISNYAEGLNLKAAKLKKDITVTDIRPGFIDTKMAKGNGRFWVAPPRKAALQIVEAISKKKRVAYVTRRWWIVAQLFKRLPFSLYRHIS